MTKPKLRFKMGLWSCGTEDTLTCYGSTTNEAYLRWRRSGWYFNTDKNGKRVWFLVYDHSLWYPPEQMSEEEYSDYLNNYLDVYLQKKYVERLDALNKERKSKSWVKIKKYWNNLLRRFK